MRRLGIAFATITLLLAACAAGTPAGTPDVTGPVETEPERPDLETPDVSLPDDGGADGGVSPQMLEDLIAQAADETGVPVDEISVVTAESVTWSDGSLGCPEPGMGYTQALVPGYRVVLDVAGEEIHFHAGRDGQFAACSDPQPPIEER